MHRIISAAALALAAATSAALASNTDGGIITTAGNLCPADTICEVGDGSRAYLHEADEKDGFGYIAVQVVASQGFLQFLLNRAPSSEQFCAFNPGHDKQGLEWPIASQIEWWSSQPFGSNYAVTLKYRSQGLVSGKIYAFTFDCSVKATSP